MALAALAVWCATVPAQSVPNGYKTAHQAINRYITRLAVKQSSTVKVIYDTTNYIDVYYNPQLGNPINDKFVAVRGSTLVIDDPEGDALYFIHLKQSDLEFVSADRTATVTYNLGDSIEDWETQKVTNNQSQVTGYQKTTTDNLALQQTLDEARKSMEEARKAMAEARKQIKEQKASELRAHTESNKEDRELETDDEEWDTEYDEEVMTSDYDWSERVESAFLWGFTNWGDKWYNGLAKMDGAYNLKTSFSSYQIELQYAVIMSRHFNLSLGVGYESDVYHFATPLVDFDATGLPTDRIASLPNQSYSDFTNDNQLFASTNLGDWSSRMVTRYVGLPVGMGLRFDDFKICITALPALALNGKHSGLKHKLDTDGIVYQDVTDIQQFVKPYKLDVRLDMLYNCVGIFVQVATMPMLTGTKDIFPFKIGLTIKLKNNN